MSQNLKNLLANCRAGKHELKEVYIIFTGFNEEKAIRWCKNCGSIVIDYVDYDGGTIPGGIMKMKSPNLLLSGIIKPLASHYKNKRKNGS